MCSVVPFNCSEKCYEEIFQTVGFFTCCNFSIMFTPSNIDFRFWFLCLLQFLTFLWLHVFLVRKLRNHSSHESVPFKFLNVAWIQHLFKYSNKMLQCNKGGFSQVQVRHPNSSTLFQDSYWLEAAVFKRCINNADFSLILSCRPGMESGSSVFEDHAAVTSYNKLNL